MMRFLRGWKELAVIFVFAVLSAFFARHLLLAPYRVPTGSMQPALKPGDFIFVSQLAYGLKWLDGEKLWSREPRRGDLVTFSSDSQAGVTFVKRVIGLPGDRIEIRKNRLIVNGVPLAYTKLENAEDNPNPEVFDIFLETYEGQSWSVIYDKSNTDKAMPPLVVPIGEVFLLGDNRDASEDSRYWGTVPINDIFGRVTLIWLSLDWQKKWAGHRFPHVRWHRIFSKVE